MDEPLVLGGNITRYQMLDIGTGRKAIHRYMWYYRKVLTIPGPFHPPQKYQYEHDPILNIIILD